MKSHLMFNLLHSRSKDSLRLGQRFCSMYIRESWPELFYQDNDRKAMALIYNWLKDHHYFYELPKEIRR